MKPTFHRQVAAIRRLFGGSIALVAAALLVLPVTETALAQESGATLRGTVASQDAAGAGVEVTVRDVERGYTNSTRTRADGSYIFVNLKPGTYDVIVGGSSERVTLLVGQTAGLDFEIADRAETEAIEEIIVVGTRIVRFSGGEIGTNITPEMLERLPQTDRNFLAFADLAPGVQVNQGAGGEVHIRGGAQNINKVNVFLDGVSQKDYVLKGGITGQDTSRGNPFPQSAVGEYKVITQNYKAEYEHVSSAVITAVTKSGTNDFSADIFFDMTDEDLRESEPNETDGKTASSTEQYGATFSGPIIRDRLHFLVAYERKDFETPRDVTGGNAIGNVTLTPEYEALLGRFPGTFEEDLFFGKLDWWINDEHSIEFSYKYRDEVGFNFGGNRVESNAGTAVVEEERFSFRHTFARDDFQNELRLSTEDVFWAQQPASFSNAQILELATRNRILQVGGNAGYQTKGQDGWTLGNDFTWFGIEDHVIKVGVRYSQIDLNILQQNNFNPQYHYNVEVNGPGTFAVDTPYKVRWFVPASGNDVGGSFVSEQKQYGFFIQDDWDVTDRLTLNLGVRWDYEDNPTYTDFVTPANLVTTLENWPNIQDTDYNYRDYISTGNNRDNFDGAWAPRVGFSYVMGQEGLHTLFGGYGRSYDRNQFDLIKNEVLRGTFATAEFFFTSASTGDPDNDCDPMTQDNCVDWDPVYLTQAGLDGLVTDLDVLDEAHLLPEDLKTPYADQFSIGVRSDWGDLWSSEVSVSYVESHDQFSWYLGNRRDDGSFFAPGTIFGPPWGFGLPDRGRHLIIGQNDGETETTALFLKLGRAHADTWGFNVAYTYTDATENRITSGSFNLAYPTQDGYGTYKVVDVSEHRLVMTGTYDLPWEILATGKFTYRSSPYKQFLNLSNGGGQQFFDRLDPSDGDFQSFDVSLLKNFDTSFAVDGSEAWVRLDVINLFNNSNYRNFVLGFNNAEFGQPNLNSSTFGRRSVKLSAGWRF